MFYVSDRHRLITGALFQDVIELRERRWVPRNAVAVSTMTSQTHEAVGPSPRPYGTTLLEYFLYRASKRGLPIVATATAMLWSLILMGGPSLPILLPATGSGQRQAI